MNMRPDATQLIEQAKVLHRQGRLSEACIAALNDFLDRAARAPDGAPAAGR